MLSTDCYPTDVLQRYLRGDIDDTLGDSIEQHLRLCETCEDTVSELDPVDDTLIRTLQLKQQIPESEPQWIEKVAGAEPSRTTNEDQSENAADAMVGTVVGATDDTKRFGDYELLGTLGRGGMSVVFSARHLHLGREVALKVLMPASQQHAISRERFSREMRVVGGLTHPSIIGATDAGEFQDTLYLVMDKIDGVDLKHAARSEGPLPIADICAIGTQVARGLQHAHSQGVIHRDIKPSNLMLNRDGQIKILDFGLARVQSGRDVTLQTTIGQLLGTLDYMAPEQASGSEVDAQADIYALGATIFKLLTGTAPHGRSANIPIIEFLHRLANDPAPRLSTKREQVPEALCDLLESMLHRDPRQRETSAEVVADRLEKFAEGADLRALVSRVPDQFKPTLEKPRGVADQSGAVAAPVVSATRPPVGPVGWGALALASASLFGLVLVAISMMLKTPEGDFLIESDVLESLTVEVVDEKDRVELIAVDQGKAETSLRAGRYRIRLGLPSDEVKITPNVITISRKEAAIAKITRVESDATAATVLKQSPIAKPLGRDPNVAATARIELLAAMDELNLAKTADNPDEAKVVALKERVAQLRAMSRPIPTEPVYKGRTLADWTAQMRFEQDHDAKRGAALSVLQLARNLPPQQRMEITFESYSRLSSWEHDRSDRILPAYADQNGRAHSAAKVYRNFDRKIASGHIAVQLQSDDLGHRWHALVCCLYLKQEIRRGQWPGILNALQNAAESPGPAHALGQFVLAVCCPDDSQASAQLLKVNLKEGSVGLLSAMLAALNDTRFAIAKPTQLDWTTRYISLLDGNGLDEFQSSKTSLGGPLTKIDWDNVNDSQQADIDFVASGILDQLESAIDDAAKSHDISTDEGRTAHLAAADLTRKVTSFIVATSLGATQANRSVNLLQRRIEQLVSLRDHSSKTGEDALSLLDTPAEAATSILLLGGEVPQCLKVAPKTTSPYFAPHLPGQNYMDRLKEHGANRSSVYTTACWFPYQVMPMLDSQQSLRSFQNVADNLINTVGIPIIFDWLPNSSDLSHSFTNLYLQFGYPSSRGQMRLSETVKKCDVLLQRHPQWRNAILKTAQTSASQSELLIAVKLVKRFSSPETIDALHRKWLRDGDPMRSRLAIAFFRTQSTGMSNWGFPPDLIDQITDALERIAKAGPLTDSDMQDLEPISKHVADAPKLAREFVLSMIASGEVSKREGNLGFRSASMILEKHPEEIKKIESELRSALGTYKPPAADGRGQRYVELNSIIKLLKQIEEKDGRN